MARRRISFDDTGIGSLLRAGRLRVPPNQRSYRWEDEHVTDLFQDLSKAIDGEDYFLGTIVLTGTAGPIPEVTDGQQRLATTTILLAAIRDFFSERAKRKIVQQLESDFLSTIEYGSEEAVPRLALNTDDNQFFINAFLLRPEDRPTYNTADLSESNKRLLKAFQLAKRHVQDISSVMT